MIQEDSPKFDAGAPHDRDVSSRCALIAKFGSIVVISVGFVVLAGWILDISFLQSVIPGAARMKMNSAIAFILSGISLLLVAQKAANRDGSFVWLGRVVALFVSLIAIFSLGRDLFQWNSGVENLFFSSNIRMSAPASFCFFVLGIAIFIREKRSRAVDLASDALIALIALISVLVLVGYVFEFKSIYRMEPNTSMAVHTASLFVVLCISALFQRPDRPPVSLFMSGTVGGILLRRLFPYLVGIPLLFGWASLQGVKANLYQFQFGMSLVVLSSVIFLTVILYRNARALNNIETERRTTKEQLENEKYIRTIIDTSHEAFISISSDSFITEWNQQAEHLFGWSRNEVIGKKLSETIIPERYRDAHENGVGRYLTTGENAILNKRLEMEALNRKGEEFVVELTIWPVLRDGRQVFNAFIHDISERKKLEEKVKRSEEMYRLLFAKNPFPIWVFDVETLRFLTVNEAAVASYGYSEEEFLDMTIRDIRPEEDLTSLEEEVKKLGPQVHNAGIWRHRKKSGEIFPVQITTHSLTFDGRSARLVIAIDVTEREAATRELEAFSYSVSHDLRAPLRHIDGFAGILRQHAAGRLDEKGERCLKVISDSAQKMGILIDELLVFSRMGRQEMRRMQIDLNEMVKDAIGSLDHDIQGRKIEWLISPLPQVEADPSMLRLVFENLIGNALKYTRPRDVARIIIGSELAGKDIVIYIRDNGVGFDMQYVDKLFGVFQRLHRADEFEGTGIGLANVRRIITRFGGRTWAEGKLGEGATFYFSLENPIELYPATS